MGASDRSGPEEPQKKLRTGRVGRARKSGGLGIRSGTGFALAGMRGLGRSDDRKADLYADAHRKAAEQMRLVLGQMKGAATKLGQLASFVDNGMIPPEYREIYQEVLAELRDSVPPMTTAQVAEVFEADHGGPPDAVFAEFEDEPMAAASIGQVHRARLFDGTAVVVKIQYPGIADAIRADLKNAKAFTWLMPLFAPGLDSDALVAEVERSLLEELDYRAEAAHQHRFAEAYRGHPFVVVPDVVAELCGERTLVAEEVSGAGFDEMCARSQAERDRAGEILFRFAFGTLYRFGFFNADTHPGNYAFCDDGRVVFYDFGTTKVLPRETFQEFVGLAALLVDGDVDGLFAECVRTGFVPRPDRVEPERFFGWLRAQLGELICDDAVMTVTPEMVAETVASASDPRNDWYSLTRQLNVPPDAILIGRMEIGIVAVLARLRATANFHRIASEWVRDAPPSTELGRIDADFFASRR
ncbi:MAG: AarF/ABC1/UbiB kinase family protein [Acidimicrobiia bacterium]